MTDVKLFMLQENKPNIETFTLEIEHSWLGAKIEIFKKKSAGWNATISSWLPD